MEYRSMDKLGVKASLLGFGCMRFPRLADGSIDEREAERMLDYAIDCGVNYIDTAYFYHEGQSEAFVGSVLAKYPREKYLLATKLPMVSIQSLAQAKAVFAEQLARLQVGYFDFYLLHALDRHKWKRAVDLGIIAFLEEMQAEGKLRSLGFSFHDKYEVFEKILTYRTWDFCQIQLNYVDTKHQQGLRGYRLAERLEVPIIIMEPIKGGSLATLPPDISALFTDHDAKRSVASWALRWVAGLPQVKVVLSGMSTFAQVEDNLAIYSPFQPLSHRERDLVEQAARAIAERTRNGCTGCGYCMPCPFGVNIPSCFKLWNEQAMYNYQEKVKGEYKMLAAETRADQCQQCGQCEAACPQQISIREDLAGVAKDLAVD